MKEVLKIKSILVVDDNSEILDIISYHLNKNGYRVLTSTNADSAMSIVDQTEISAAILDIMMPEIDGFTLCKTIRAQHYFPILFLTAKAQETDKLEGLACGADDYMMKPFSSKELLARIDSLIRRCTEYNPKQDHAVLQIANLKYNQLTGVISVSGLSLDITDIEYRILLLLLRQSGTPINTEFIYNQIWGEIFTISSNNNVVVHIKNLRKKINMLDNEVEYIHTVWGKGYAIYV